MSEAGADLANLIRSRLAELPARVTPQHVQAIVITAVKDWQEQLIAAELVVERDADDPNRVSIWIGPNLARLFGFANLDKAVSQ